MAQKKEKNSILSIIMKRAGVATYFYLDDKLCDVMNMLDKIEQVLAQDKEGLFECCNKYRLQHHKVYNVHGNILENHATITFAEFHSTVKVSKQILEMYGFVNVDSNKLKKTLYLNNSFLHIVVPGLLIVETSPKTLSVDEPVFDIFD